MKLTADTITDEHLEALKSVAYEEGNQRLVSLCYVALIEPAPLGLFARARCAEIFNERASEFGVG